MEEQAREVEDKAREAAKKTCPRENPNTVCILPSVYCISNTIFASWLSCGEWELCFLVALFGSEFAWRYSAPITFTFKSNPIGYSLRRRLVDFYWVLDHCSWRPHPRYCCFVVRWGAWAGACCSHECFECECHLHDNINCSCWSLWHMNFDGNMCATVARRSRDIWHAVSE